MSESEVNPGVLIPGEGTTKSIDGDPSCDEVRGGFEGPSSCS